MNARGDTVGTIGAALLGIIGGLALLAPMLAPYDPWLQVTTPFAVPSMAHPLGANDAGQDLLSELLYGARVSLLIGALAAVMATLVGTTVGVVAGFFRGMTDAALMRLADVLLALPFLPLVIVVGVYVGPGLVTEIIVIGALIWAGTAREIRSQVLSLREQSYVAAARAMGGRSGYLLTRHVVPAIAPLVIPQLVRAANVAILVDASLSFLGVGDPTVKSWGMTLYYANARSAFLTDAWLWWVLPPGICITAVVLGFALLGYALEERARPRLRSVGRGRPILPPLEHTRSLDPGDARVDRPLVVDNLTVEYATPGGGTRRAVDDVSFSIRRGESLGIVGESGSGKTTLVTTVLGLLTPPARITNGRVLLAGENLAALRPTDLQRLRGKTVALIPQGAMNALNPVMTIGNQIAEAITVHRALDRRALRARVGELLSVVGIPPERRVAYPHEFSGGMRQRVVIAMALANDPDLIIADEPTSGLDLIVQAEILALLADLRARLGLSLLFISHDLPIVLQMADRLAVMQRGQIVEQGDARTIAAKPSHACTRRLLDAVPRLHDESVTSPATATRATEAPVLEVLDVRKSFRGRGWRAARHVVLDGVTLTVDAGEAVGLVGGSGVGKSTLARLVVGLEQPDAGQIRFEGRDVWARERIHLVFQDPYDALPPSMRVQDIVSEPLTIHGVGTRTDRIARVRETLEETALTPADRFLQRYPQELSGGERQRVALARAIILRPRLIIADEPTTMLDLPLRLELLALMKRLGQRHAISYLYITHDLALARAFCDRLVILHEGHVVEEGPAADVIERPNHPYTTRLVSAASLLRERRPRLMVRQ
jgi:ABC-type glutathione transport system ATPase component/ABC-type dipeptide/oligopeptide/nickel transport system permease subunit